MDNEIDRKIDVTAIHFLLVQNRQQTHDWTLIGSGANGIGIQVCIDKLGEFCYPWSDKGLKGTVVNWGYPPINGG